VSSNEFHTLMAEMVAIRKRQNALLLVVCVLVFWMVKLSFGSDMAIAKADRDKFPADEHAYLYYLTTNTIDPTQRELAGKILRFAVASLTTETTLENQLPVVVAPGLYRIHTKNLGWDGVLPELLAQDYPYGIHPGRPELVVRADWFIQYALDQEVGGDAYLRLLFGKPIKTLDEFLAEFGVDKSNPLRFGHIETTSGVAINRTRIVSTFPTNKRTDCWITYDFVELNKNNDPIENLDRGIRDAEHNHDASELIVGIPKASATTGQTGALQAYLLANGAGEVQVKAPTNIVVDSTRIRGVEIRNAVSCIACHLEGLRPLKQNGLKSYLQSGAAAFAKHDVQADIERFHLTGLDKYIERANEDYEAAVKMVNGLTAADNAIAFKAIIQAYDQDLTLDAAARELSAKPELMKNALAWWSSLGKPMSARLASMAHGLPMPRTSWESSEYRQAYQIWRAYLAEWKRRKAE
jgi:hypothetical protein